MALNFPNSPTNGQLYTDALSGNSWTWDSANTCWKSTSTYIQTITVSSSAPGTPAIGQLWWNRDYGRLLVYYSDGDTSQWVDASPSDYTSQLAYNQANAVSIVANNAFANTSGTFNGNLTVSGNVIANKQVTVTYTPATSVNATITLAAANTQGGTGYADFLKATNLSGGTNPNKTFRLNSTGSIEVINSAYTANLLTLDDSGRITKPLQPLFKAYTTGFSKAATWEKVTGLSTVTYNIGSHYDSSSSKFTAPVTGNYMFLCGGWASSTSSGERYAFSFRVNAGGQTFISGSNYCTGDSPVIQHTEIITLAANDYVDLYGFSAVSTTWGGGSHVFWFSGYLIG